MKPRLDMAEVVLATRGFQEATVQIKPLSELSEHPVHSSWWTKTPLRLLVKVNTPYTLSESQVKNR